MSNKYVVLKGKADMSAKEEQAAENLSPLDVLKQDCGGEVSVVNEPLRAKDLEEQGYVKLSEDAFAQLSSFMQYMPGIISDRISQKTVEGAYRITIPEGAVLLQKSNGAFITAYKTPSSARIAGQADTIPLNTTAETTAAMVHSIFSAASVITGQYFMTCIDNKLGGIQSSVSNIQQFLETDKETKLIATADSLMEIWEDAPSIVINRELIQPTLNRVGNKKDELNHLNEFYKSELEKAVDAFTERKSAKNIKIALERIEKALLHYLDSVRLYQFASELELMFLSQIDSMQIHRVANRLLKKSKEFHDEYDKCKESVRKHIMTTAALKPTVLPYTVDVIKILLNIGLFAFFPSQGLIMLKNTIDNTAELVAKYQVEDESGRNRYLMEFEKEIAPIDPKSLEEIPKIIMDMGKSQELLYTADALYIKRSQPDVVTG